MYACFIRQWKCSFFYFKKKFFNIVHSFNRKKERRSFSATSALKYSTMARHNEVTLYGQVPKDPILLYRNNDSNDKLLRAVSLLMVIRGIRDFGAKDQRMKLDEVVIMSGNERIMSLMRNWKAGDIVSIRGTLITNDYMKSCTCSACQHTQQYRGYSAYVYPIHVQLIAQGYTPEQGLIALKQNSEVSNRITVIGYACDKPKIHAHERSGTKISSYVIDIARKYRIREDDESNRHDFPVVKSYGEIAENDYIAIEPHGMVFIDGQLQVRNYTRQFICENCGEPILKVDNVTEIVPYSTEYLTGCHTMEEVIEIREKEKERAEIEAFADGFQGSNHDEEGTDDLEDTDYADAEKQTVVEDEEDA